MNRPLHLQRSDLAIVVIALLYILSPFDLVPEIVAGPLGLTDDVAAAGILGMTLWRARKTAKEDRLAGRSDQPKPPGAEPDSAPTGS
jgi:uncharacterized membrane protein YkvA (DUF1232 family)